MSDIRPIRRRGRPSIKCPQAGRGLRVIIRVSGVHLGGHLGGALRGAAACRTTGARAPPGVAGESCNRLSAGYNAA